MKSTFLILAVLTATAIGFAEDTTPGKGKGKGKGQRPDLRKLDTNGDKAISKEEAGAEIWERLGRLDKNGDGKVAGDEFPRPGNGERPGMPGGGDGKGKMAEFMKRIDKNGDGNISKEEAPEQAWARLSKMDKNGDDIITKEEMASAARARFQPGQLFAYADKNKDEKLTKEEIPRLWERLGKADRDGDGAISKSEMEAVAAYAKGRGGDMMKGGGKGGSRGGGANSIFERFDEDKDGKLNREEVPDEMWARLSRADEDADGRVSKSELENVYKKARGMYGDGPGKGKGKGKGPAGDDDGVAKPKRPAFEEGTEA